MMGRGQVETMKSFLPWPFYGDGMVYAFVELDTTVIIMFGKVVFLFRSWTVTDNNVVALSLFSLQPFLPSAIDRSMMSLLSVSFRHPCSFNVVAVVVTNFSTLPSDQYGK
jgi:hypothetical protein